MSIIGRALRGSWAGILLLCCGGCAVHPFIDSSAKVARAASGAAIAPPAAAAPISVSPSEPLAAQPAPIVSPTDQVDLPGALRSMGLTEEESEQRAKLITAMMMLATTSVPSDDAAARTGAAEDLSSDGIRWTRRRKVTPHCRRPKCSPPRTLLTRRHVRPHSPNSQYPLESPPPRPQSGLSYTRSKDDTRSVDQSRSSRTPWSTEGDAENRTASPKPAPLDAPLDADKVYLWRDSMRAAADQLRTELDQSSLTPELRSKYEVVLSLLLLVDEDPEQALSALENFDDQELEFWRQTVLGMGVLLDSDSISRRQDRVERATEHLHQGLDSLSTQCRLQVRNLAFCTKINGFGDFVECQPTEIEPDAQLLLYVEVENYQAEPLSTGRSQANWLAGTQRRGDATERCNQVCHGVARALRHLRREPESDRGAELTGRHGTNVAIADGTTSFPTRSICRRAWCPAPTRWT